VSDVRHVTYSVKQYPGSECFVCSVVHTHKHTLVSSSLVHNGLLFVKLRFGFFVCMFFLHSGYSLLVLGLAFWVFYLDFFEFGCQYLCSRFPGKTYIHNKSIPVRYSEAPLFRRSAIPNIRMLYTDPAARAWNTLTPSVQSSESLPIFRRRLKTKLFSRSFPD